MSRANSTARRSSQAPEPSTAAIAYAFVGPKCKLLRPYFYILCVCHLANRAIIFLGDFRNRKVGSENACLDEILYLPYDYGKSFQYLDLRRSLNTWCPTDITAWTVHILVALYALATFVHIVQAIVSKRWFLLGKAAAMPTPVSTRPFIHLHLIGTFALCGLCETLGVSNVVMTLHCEMSKCTCSLRLLVGRKVVERFDDSLGSKSWGVLVFGAESIFVSFEDKRY